MDYSTTLTDMPIEILSQIYQELSLEDIANLQEAHPWFESTADYLFYSNLKKMRITWDERGAMVTLSPRSTHSYMSASYTVMPDSPQRDRILQSCLSVDSLTISCNDHNKDYSLLSFINRTGISLSKLVINLTTPEGAICRKTVNRSHRKLTSFVREQSESLMMLKVSTSPEDTVSFDLRPEASTSTDSGARIVYSHKSDLQTHYSLIYPIFDAFNLNKPGPSNVSLTVDWRRKLDLALQSAFLVALPCRHRSAVRKMRIGFSAKVSSLSHDEIHDCLETFSLSLNDTHRMQELLCDFTKSKIDPCQLERTIKALSSQLGKVHRIRVLTDCPSSNDEASIIKEQWNQLPKVY